MRDPGIAAEAEVPEQLRCSDVEPDVEILERVKLVPVALFHESPYLAFDFIQGPTCRLLARIPLSRTTFW